MYPQHGIPGVQRFFNPMVRSTDGSHPGGHPPLSSEQFVVLRRSVLPQVRVRCGRDEKCCKENGHRGRCSLQLKPKEDDMLRLVEQVRVLQAELAETQGDRDRLKVESSTLWAKLMQVSSPPRRARWARECERRVCRARAYTPVPRCRCRRRSASSNAPFWKRWNTPTCTCHSAQEWHGGRWAPIPPRGSLVVSRAHTTFLPPLRCRRALRR